MSDIEYSIKMNDVIKSFDCSIKNYLPLAVTPLFAFYSKTCLKWPIKNRQNKGLKDNGCLMESKVWQNAPLGAFCNTFDMHKTIIRIESQFLAFFLSGCLRQVYCSHCCLFQIKQEHQICFAT